MLLRQVQADEQNNKGDLSSQLITSLYNFEIVSEAPPLHGHCICILDREAVALRHACFERTNEALLVCFSRHRVFKNSSCNDSGQS